MSDQAGMFTFETVGGIIFLIAFARPCSVPAWAAAATATTNMEHFIVVGRVQNYNTEAAGLNENTYAFGNDWGDSGFLTIRAHIHTHTQTHTHTTVRGGILTPTLTSTPTPSMHVYVSHQHSGLRKWFRG